MRSSFLFKSLFPCIICLLLVLPILSGCGSGGKKERKSKKGKSEEVQETDSTKTPPSPPPVVKPEKSEDPDAPPENPDKPFVKLDSDLPMIATWNNDLGTELTEELKYKTFEEAYGILKSKITDRFEKTGKTFGTLKPDYSNAVTVVRAMTAIQMELRQLQDALRTLYSKDTNESKENVKTATISELDKKIFPFLQAIQVMNMPRLQAEMNAYPKLCFTDPIDFAAVVKEHTPEKSTSSSSSSSDDYSDSSSSSSSSGSLKDKVEESLASIAADAPDASKLPSVLKTVTELARSQVPGYKSSSGNSYDSYSSSSSDDSSSPSSSSGRGTRPSLLDSLSGTGGGKGSASSTKKEAIDKDVQEVITIALKKLIRNDDADLATEAIKAYCILATEDIVPEVIDFLFEQQHPQKANEACCEAILIEDAYKNDPRVLAILADYMEEDPKWAHSKMKDLGPMAAKIAFSKLKSSNEATRSAALLIVSEAGDAETALAIASFVDDENAAVREHVIETLGRIGDERSAPFLVRRLINEEDREFAKKALIQLGPAGEKVLISALVQKNKDGIGRPDPLQTDIDEVVLEILHDVGTWNSLHPIGKLLLEQRYGVRTSEYNISDVKKDYLLYLSLSTGTAIIERMTGMKAPSLKSPLSAEKTLKNQENPDRGSSSSDYSSSSDDYDGNPNRTERVASDYSSVPAGRNPFHWYNALLLSIRDRASAGIEITRNVTAGNAESAGIEYKKNIAVIDMLEDSIDQALETCKPSISLPEDKQKIHENEKNYKQSLKSRDSMLKRKVLDVKSVNEPFKRAAGLSGNQNEQR